MHFSFSFRFEFVRLSNWPLLSVVRFVSRHFHLHNNSVGIPSDMSLRVVVPGKSIKKASLELPLRRRTLVHLVGSNAYAAADHTKHSDARIILSTTSEWTLRKIRTCSSRACTARSRRRAHSY